METPCVSSTTHTIPIHMIDKPSECSLLQYIFGYPCKCNAFDTAEITTMELKYRIHPKIGEFWCFITSLFYGSSLLLYLVKKEDWFKEWSTGWPIYVHFSVAISVIVMICSAIYHSCLLEITGCIDCFFASFMYASATMTVFGVDMMTQIGVLLLLGVIHLNTRRYITRIAIIIMTLIFPFALLSYTRMKSYYGGTIFALISIGVVCFLMDRMKYAPLHSVWHILSGSAIAMTLYYVVINGTQQLFTNN